MQEGMKAGNIRFGGPFGWFLRILFVLLFWAGGFYTLFVLRAPTVPQAQIPTLVLPQQSTSPNSTAGPMRYTRWDPQQGNRIQFSISLDNLTVKPGTLGVFQTGLFKTVQVRSLQMRRYEYQSDPDTQGLGMVSEDTALRALELDNPELVKGIFSGDQEPLRLSNEMEIQVDRPDVSDAGQLLVENFDYQIVYEGKPRLSISSKRAFASWEDPGILLRGGVVVTAADGGTVRSNRIRWNPRDRVFSVEDNYLLTQGPSRSAGKSVYLDEQLNIIDAARAASNQYQPERPNYARR